MVDELEDLRLHLSGQEKLKNLASWEELQTATISVQPSADKRGRQQRRRK